MPQRLLLVNDFQIWISESSVSSYMRMLSFFCDIWDCNFCAWSALHRNVQDSHGSFRRYLDISIAWKGHTPPLLARMATLRSWTRSLDLDLPPKSYARRVFWRLGSFLLQGWQLFGAGLDLRILTYRPYPLRRKRPVEWYSWVLGLATLRGAGLVFGLDLPSMNLRIEASTGDRVLFITRMAIFCGAGRLLRIYDLPDFFFSRLDGLTT